MLDAQSVIDSMLRGVAISAVNRAVFERKPVFSMGTVNQGVRLGAASLGYDVVVKPAVKQVFPTLPLPNGN